MLTSISQKNDQRIQDYGVFSEKRLVDPRVSSHLRIFRCHLKTGFNVSLTKLSCVVFLKYMFMVDMMLDQCISKCNINNSLIIFITNNKYTKFNNSR